MGRALHRRPLHAVGDRALGRVCSSRACLERALILRRCSWWLVMRRDVRLRRTDQGGLTDGFAFFISAPATWMELTYGTVSTGVS